jgi:hypothetical protein
VAVGGKFCWRTCSWCVRRILTFTSSVLHSPVSVAIVSISTRLLSSGWRITRSRNPSMLLSAVSIRSHVCDEMSYNVRYCKQWLSLTRADCSQVWVLLNIMGPDCSISWLTLCQIFSGEAGMLKLRLIGSRSLAFCHLTIVLRNRCWLISSGGYGR